MIQNTFTFTITFFPNISHLEKRQGKLNFHSLNKLNSYMLYKEIFIIYINK